MTQTLFSDLEKTIDERITRKIRRNMEENDKKISERTTPQLYLDIWNRILDDSWMYPVAWGQPRTGKTTVALKAAFDVYEDWDHVLQSIVFTLAGLLYKMRNGEPIRIRTLNGLHHRVPFIIGDDWAAQNNKAKTQHEPAWDIFKGAFDTLGTKVAVFMVTMNNPSGITDQLQTKYTHEIYVENRGEAKYDIVDWQQNFYGWQPKQDKTWLQTYDFTEVPSSVYRDYDEMRKSLVDELFQIIDDAMIENEGLRIFKRLNQDDVDFIELLYAKGRVSNDWINSPVNYKYKEVLKRCKARSIVVPIRKGTTYWYDLTDFGFNLHQLIQAKQQEGTNIPAPVATPKQRGKEDKNRD
jgi:hypothetical protein